MTYEGFGEMFEGDSAAMCGGKFLLMLIVFVISRTLRVGLWSRPYSFCESFTCMPYFQSWKIRHDDANGGPPM